MQASPFHWMPPSIQILRERFVIAHNALQPSVVREGLRTRERDIMIGRTQPPWCFY